MRKIILIVGCSELALFLVTRLVIAHWSAWEWQPELLRTAARAAEAGVIWYFFRDIIFSSPPNKAGVRHLRFFAALAVMLSVPLLIGDWSFMGPFTRGVFAAASIVVGIHEEFLFRGLLQNLVEKRLGTLKAIGVSGLVMTVWHIGALSLNFFNFWQVFSTSIVFGLIFAATRSIWLVAAVHAAYDAIWSATPVLSKPLAWYWGSLLLLVAVLLAWSWVRAAYWPDPSFRGTLLTPAARPESKSQALPGKGE